MILQLHTQVVHALSSSLVQARADLSVKWVCEERNFNHRLKKKERERKCFLGTQEVLDSFLLWVDKVGRILCEILFRCN